MIDFLLVSTRTNKKGTIEIYPKFIVKESSDLMIRGGDFYAIWNEKIEMWSTKEQDALNIIDNELDIYYQKHKDDFDQPVRVLHLWDSENGMIDRWHKFVQKQLWDNYHSLDEKLIFADTVTTKEDYATKRLPYLLKQCDIPGYERLVSTLYSPEEREKIEWAVGSIISGDSLRHQKFLVLYGSAGTGKSTMLNIIQQLFDGYYCVFDAKALGSSNNSFALESFKKNPLVAIQHDGDLSRIEDNTRLNSLVAHELMTVNEKFKSTYSNRFNAFLFMGTNKPVKITDARSGLIRRLIDVTPTGNTLGPRIYKQCISQIPFELGGIAWHCQEVYKSDPDKYDSYIPSLMMSASNDFYNYVIDNYHIFVDKDAVTLAYAWELYNKYCLDAKVMYPMSRRAFQEELKSYFWEFHERITLDDGKRVRSYYSGFRTDRFEESGKNPDEEIPKIEFKKCKSIFDSEYADRPAQYANEKEIPQKKWSEVTTKLSDLNTSELHYVKLPKDHIVIDFDLKDENGKKCFEKNLEEASKWPATYAELSKSGAGIHLHYLYSGDVTKLRRIYAEDIEVKVFTGNSSLRRKLSKCNKLPIATIDSGLPLKEEKVLDKNIIQNERGLRKSIEKSLLKQVHGHTKPEIDWIYEILERAYKDGMKYDVSDLRNDIFAFAASSHNQAEYCIKLVGKMKFQSEEAAAPDPAFYDQYVIFDVEVKPNLSLICYKLVGEDKPVIRLFNPTPEQVEELCRYKLIGFNCRRYDNHILYSKLLGFTPEETFDISNRIINGDKSAFFSNAYNLSYYDIYDGSSKKQSLKKWEIELGIFHKEFEEDWDKPIEEDKWEELAEYCDNDVIATETLFLSDIGQADFTARQILADIAGGIVNDTTNTLTTRLIFEGNREPQSSFNYRFMGCDEFPFGNEYTKFDDYGRPLFPGYKFDRGKSTYRGEVVGEGGYVYAEPGMYRNVALLDIASMHPSSLIAEKLFGEVYTQRFADLKQARIYIKHGEFDKAEALFDGKLAPYLKDKSQAKKLSGALKIAINSVYGLTAATFDNTMKDPRNIDNIVAKRGALFMINLKHEVQDRGYTVAHIKTDSIKIPDATPEIIQFITDYGKRYGYDFEHEATYDRMCLVNDAVYIAKYKGGEHDGEWTATGAQFAVPYVFKTLFSHEPIMFDDYCETKSVTKGNIYLDMNEDLPDVSDIEKELDKLESKYKKGLLSDTNFEKESVDLVDRIAVGHHYHFVGRVGRFCPVAPGKKGGLLVRAANGKYYAVTGTKGYRWMESDMVKNLIVEDPAIIDKNYFRNLANDAIENMSQYGDFDWFINSDTNDISWYVHVNQDKPEGAKFA